LTGQIPTNDHGKDYSVQLSLVDAATNANKFYNLQIVEVCNSKFFLVQHWGRIGAVGQSKVDEFGDLDSAAMAMKQKYLQKVGIAFDAAPGARAKGKLRYSKTEMKAKLAGGKLADNDTTTFCLAWDARVDLDLHVWCPDGQHCYFSQKQVRNSCGAPYCELDVDKTAMHFGQNQVENIAIDKRVAPKGEYVVKVRLYSAACSDAEKAAGIPWKSTFRLGEAAGEEKEGRSAATGMPGDIEVARFFL
jgi:predicted DNA-binding WGR domain protein